MAISPINFFLPTTAARGAEPLETLVSPTLLSSLTGSQRAELTTFAREVGQALAATGTLPLEASFATQITRELQSENPLDGIFDNRLLAALGLRTFNLQSQLARLLVGNLGSPDPLGNLLAPDTARARTGLFFREGADGSLFVQLNLGGLGIEVQLEPQIFSASALAQRFQVGNGTGSPE